MAGVLFSGCATPEDPPFSSGPTGAPAETPRPSAASDVFSLGDQVTVIFSDPQLQPHEERIKGDGTITLHLIGSVKAVGKTPGELQKEIQDLYVPKYYQAGRLTVTVKALERTYSVLGEVRAPGPKAYLGITTVTKAIGAAGGLTEFASKRAVYLTRANGTKIKVNYKKAIADPKADPQVFPGDAVNVERSIW